MTDTRPLILGARVFDVPPLPFSLNIKAYPLLRKLNNEGFVGRWFAKDVSPSEEDLTLLADALFLCARAADSELTRAAFDALPVTPDQMIEGMLVARFQSGGWVPAEEGAGEGAVQADAQAGETQEGEALGEPEPPTSTSAESSEN